MEDSRIHKFVMNRIKQQNCKIFCIDCKHCTIDGEPDEFEIRCEKYNSNYEELKYCPLEDDDEN